MEDYPDDAERAEELQRAPDTSGPETPEADALDQAAPVAPADDDDQTEAVGDAPEGDALEQRQAVRDDADADERR